jgi:hypothetical protein
MAEPDNKMGSDQWPPDWSTGWISGIWLDAVGQPLTGTVTVKLSVRRAASLSSHTTIDGGKRVFSIVHGVPSGEHVVLNGAGIPCVEFPTTDDPNVQPADLQLVVTESWSSTSYRYELLAVNTLENPMWITGDLTSIEPQPGVIRTNTYTIMAPPYVQPPEAVVGDWVVFKKGDGDLVEVFVVS